MSILDRLIRRDGDDAPRLREVLSVLNENASAFREQFPEDKEIIDAFLGDVENDCRNRYPRYARSASEYRHPLNAMVRIRLSADRMRAWACVIPPMDGGAEITPKKLRDEMRSSNVVHGVLEDRITACTGEEDCYLNPFLVARGTPPRDGIDSVLTECFQPDADIRLEVSSMSAVDFSAGLPQPVRKDEVICTIQPAVPGSDGSDVTGWGLLCRKPVQVSLPAGDGTRASEDGLSLLADREGILYRKDGKFCIRPARTVFGSLDIPSGSCKHESDLFITGDVAGGASVETTGDILIAGEVRDARVVSTGGTIRILKGIHGVNGKTVVRAARQLQALSIEDAQVEAGGNVIAEMISNSEVHSGASVLVKGGKGVILGGDIEAMRMVDCRQLGNVNGKLTKIVVGFSPEDAADRDRIQQTLSETQTTLEKLWKMIGDLRRGGSKLPDEKRVLLDQLVEQRTLYEEHEAQIKAEHKALQEKLRAANHGKVLCEQLYPIADVQIGLCRMEFKHQENGCNIHVYGDTLTVR